MLMCPVDLAVCERAGCSGHLCEMAGVSPLLLCWECGAVEGRAHGAEVCVVCLHLYRPTPTAEGA